MRRVLVAVLLALAIVLAGAGCSDDGEDAPPPLADFTAADARFQARLPGTPTRSEQDVPTAAGDLRLVTYTAQVRPTYGFSVGWFQLAAPPEADRVRPFLESTKRGIVATVEGELESSEYVEVGGSPGIDYVAKMKAGGYVKARTVVVGRDVYVLQMITEKRDAAQYREFIEGFHVLPAG